MLDVEEKLLRLPNGNTCPYQDEHYYDADYGNVYWTVALPQCSGDEEDKSSIYEGLGHLLVDYSVDPPPSQYIQVHHKGYDFQILLLQKTTYICGYRSYFTEHPNLFATILPDAGPRFDVRRKVSHLDVSL